MESPPQEQIPRRFVIPGVEEYPAGREAVTLGVPPGYAGMVLGLAILGLQGWRCVYEVQNLLASGEVASAGLIAGELKPFLPSLLVGLAVLLWSGIWSRVTFDPMADRFQKRTYLLGIPAGRSSWPFQKVRYIDIDTPGSGDLPGHGTMGDGFGYYQTMRGIGCLFCPLLFVWRLLPRLPAPYRLYVVMQDRTRILVHGGLRNAAVAERGSLIARMTRSRLT